MIKKTNLLIVTAILLAIFCGATFAAVLNLISGPGRITIVGVTGSKLGYSSPDVSHWTSDDIGINNLLVNDPWYVRIHLGTVTWTGTAKVTWYLYKDGILVELATKNDFTTLSLTPSNSGTYIYCSPDGTIGTNQYNWGIESTSIGSYEIRADIHT